MCIRDRVTFYQVVIWPWQGDRHEVSHHQTTLTPISGKDQVQNMTTHVDGAVDMKARQCSTQFPLRWVHSNSDSEGIQCFRVFSAMVLLLPSLGMLEYYPLARRHSPPLLPIQPVPFWQLLYKPGKAGVQQTCGSRHFFKGSVQILRLQNLNTGKAGAIVISTESAATTASKSELILQSIMQIVFWKAFMARIRWLL